MVDGVLIPITLGMCCSCVTVETFAGDELKCYFCGRECTGGYTKAFERFREIINYKDSNQMALSSIDRLEKDDVRLKIIGSKM